MSYKIRKLTFLFYILSIDFVENTDPDQDYIDAALPILEAHMMTGASRLAALMVDIYGSGYSFIQN